MKIISVVGDRPNFMKVAPIHRAIKKYLIENLSAYRVLRTGRQDSKSRIQHLICHTGQHYDEKMSKVFFDEIRNGGDENSLEFKSQWMEKIINSQSVIFQNIYDQLNKNQRKILLTLFHSTEEIFSNANRKKYNLPTSSTLSTNIKSLVQKGLIFKEDTIYKISNPIFKNWLTTL